MVIVEAMVERIPGTGSMRGMVSSLPAVARPVRGPTPARAGALLVAALLAAGVVAACSGASAPAVSATAPVAPAPPPAVETATPVATPTATPTAAATAAAASAASLTAQGASTAVFSPPPPLQAAPPPGESGIARVIAPALGLDHYVAVVRVVDNQMQAPADGSYAVGWYPEYGPPGVAGNAIFTAHESWNHLQGPFYSLHRAQEGDELTVVMADGLGYRYRVISKARYAVDTMPMSAILWPGVRPADEQWITLITCGGRIVYDASGFGEYLDRDVVVARRIE